MNKYFKSSNIILSTLNEKHWVCQRTSINGDKVPNTFDVYYKPEGGGLDFLCTLIAKPTTKKSVTFNGKSYSDIDILLNEIEAFNSTRFFPSRCYDPMCMEWANEERKIAWYLSKRLGLEIGSDVGYSIKDAMGKEILHINFEMDYNNRWMNKEERKDSTGGILSRSLGLDKWISMRFENADDAVSQLNSLISVQLITDINSNFDILSKITGPFNSLENANIESIELMLKGQKIKYRDKVLPILKQLVEAFESE